MTSRLAGNRGVCHCLATAADTLAQAGEVKRGGCPPTRAEPPPSPPRLFCVVNLKKRQRLTDETSLPWIERPVNRLTHSTPGSRFMTQLLDTIKGSTVLGGGGGEEESICSGEDSRPSDGRGGDNALKCYTLLRERQEYDFFFLRSRLNGWLGLTGSGLCFSAVGREDNRRSTRWQSLWWDELGVITSRCGASIWARVAFVWRAMYLLPWPLAVRLHFWLSLQVGSDVRFPWE